MALDEVSQSARGPRGLAGGPPPGQASLIGILLVNLGTPDGTGYWPMRRYLKEFLSDRRVIEVPRLLWWPILNLAILTVASDEERRQIRRDLGQGRQRLAAPRHHPIADREAGPRHVPAVSTGSGWRSPCATALPRSPGDRPPDGGGLRAHPPGAALSAICRRHDSHGLRQGFRASRQAALAAGPAGRAALARRSGLCRGPGHLGARSLARLDFEPEVILASFHGVPKKYLLAGDPYHCFALKTGRLLRRGARSRMRRACAPPSSPASAATNGSSPIRTRRSKPWRDRGVKRLAIVAPGFVADCLETLEELAVENRDIFLRNGGEHFAYLPCLNDTQEGMRVLEHVVARELQGWI